jgi:hypothetical protein
VTLVTLWAYLGDAMSAVSPPKEFTGAIPSKQLEAELDVVNPTASGQTIQLNWSCDAIQTEFLEGRLHQIVSASGPYHLPHSRLRSQVFRPY